MARKNIIKNVPSLYDYVVKIDGKNRFVARDNTTSEFLNSHDVVGMVYDIQGNLIRIVGGINNQSKRAACVADYEITAIPSESGDYKVKLLNAVVGNFTYTKSEGTIEEFATQLNTWLETNAPEWEAYTRDGHSYLQMSTYDTYESTVSIAGTTLVKLIWSTVADYTILTGGRNAVKQYAVGNGMNRARLEEAVKDNTSDDHNPTTRMNGTTQLFVSFPCSKAYYDGELGDGLRENFKTYGAYLDACMVISEDLDRGLMKFRDGKLMTALLKDKNVLVKGVETYANTAARWAADYDTNIEGFRAGDWWLPSMYELSKLMRVAQQLNVGLTKKSGWSAIPPSSIRWSSSHCNTNITWRYGGGFAGTTYFYRSFAVSAVSAFILEP